MRRKSGFASFQMGHCNSVEEEKGKLKIRNFLTLHSYNP